MIFALLLVAAPTVKSFVSSNGWATLQYSVEQKRFDRFLQHPYKYESDGVATRDLLVDAHFDVEAPNVAPNAAPSTVRYDNGTGIIVATGGQFTTSGFVPRDLAAPGFVMALTIEGPVHDLVVKSVLLTRLGGDRPEPAGTGEYIQYTEKGFEAFGPFQASSATACSRALPAADVHNYPTPTNGDDLSPSYEWHVTLAAGESKTLAVLVSFDNGNIAQDAWGRLDDWLAGEHDPAVLLQRERAAWGSVELPADMSEQESALYRQSLAVLQMAQVQESGHAHGQILASIAASTSAEYNQWNITWVRDMAYATSALAEAGKLEAAKRALVFQMQAQSGKYQKDFVGKPYQVSVCRYFGNGEEESDVNQDGPNIEYDGFGLFLWSLGRYYAQSGDDTLIGTYWPLVKAQVADVLVGLVEPYSGLIKADSSIWETHQNGKQRQFAYTSITAVAGLCAAGDLAETRGEKAAARTYRNAAKQIRQAILDKLVGADHVIAASLEERGKAHDYYDAAVVEAITLGVIDPKGEVARSTLQALRDKLSAGPGRGLFRNDEGGDYDNQEWIMIDLRMSQALRMADMDGSDLWQWVTTQSADNGNLIAELYDRKDASYAGSVPMVGFGAGAYLLTAHHRFGMSTAALPCGGYDNALDDASAAATPQATPPAATEIAAGCGAGGLPAWWLVLLAHRLWRRRLLRKEIQFLVSWVPQRSVLDDSGQFMKKRVTRALDVLR